jgi:hypothetical protein
MNLLPRPSVTPIENENNFMQRYEMEPNMVRQIDKLCVYQSMRNLILYLSVLLAGCSSSTTQVSNQSVEDIAWLPDESGLIAYMETTSVSEVDGSEALSANLYHVSTNGAIGNAIDASDQAVSTDFTPLVFVSSNGKTALTAFENNTFSIDLSSGNATNINSGSYMYGVSAGLHYMISDLYQPTLGVKPLQLYDLTASPIKLVGISQTHTNVTGNRALWIDSTMYALTVYDSALVDGPEFDHITIYDLNGDSVYGIPDAQGLLHTSAYAPGTHELFFLTNELGIAKYNLTTRIRTPIKIMPNDSVESLDVSADGSILVYSSQATNNANAYQGYAINVSSGNIVPITNGMVTLLISPNKDRVAYIDITDATSDEGVGVVALPQP